MARKSTALIAGAVGLGLLLYFGGSAKAGEAPPKVGAPPKKGAPPPPPKTDDGRAEMVAEAARLKAEILASEDFELVAHLSLDYYGYRESLGNYDRDSEVENHLYALGDKAATEAMDSGSGERVQALKEFMAPFPILSGLAADLNAWQQWRYESEQQAGRDAEDAAREAEQAEYERQQEAEAYEGERFGG